MPSELNYSVPMGSFRTEVRYLEASEAQNALDGAALAVFDENTAPLFAGYSGPRVVLPAGERYKTLDSVQKILDAALEAGLGRDSLIVGAGGGVITDMAALAASLFMRGCRLRLVPTSLLAMVDAALGGKTGVDYQGFKNLVGTFYPADELVIVPSLLNTLPQREYLCGLAEVLKAALLRDPELWSLLAEQRPAVLDRQPEVLNTLIQRSLRVKARIVEADLKEQGERAHLNLGHTFAHALETASGFTGVWNHGEAVAWGIVQALRLSERLGLCPSAYPTRIQQVFEAYGYRTLQNDVSPADIVKAMVQDKKKARGRVRFILQRGPQDTLLQEVPLDQVQSLLESAP